MNNKWASGYVYRAPAGDDGGDGGGGDGDGDGGGDGDGDGGDGGGGDGDGDGGGDGDGDGDGDGGDGGSGKGDTWRTNLAGENKEWSTRLERYTDQDKFLESAFQAHDKIRAGELARGLPADATEEQVSDWRVANDIPLTPDKYEFVGTDRELSEMDIEMMSGNVAEIAHKHNISQEALSELMNGYMAETDKVVEQMHTQDNLDAQEFTKLAKENWGPEYQINMNRANNQINLLPEAVRDSFKQARMPDGRALMNSAEVMTWLVNVDRAVTPMDPIKGGQEATLNDARKVVEEAKARMRDDSVGWHKDKKAQANYMQAQTMIDQFEGSQ
jgi:hypothetical protein